jgi:hypothetical protein
MGSVAASRAADVEQAVPFQETRTARFGPGVPRFSIVILPRRIASGLAHQAFLAQSDRHEWGANSSTRLGPRWHEACPYRCSNSAHSW